MTGFTPWNETETCPLCGDAHDLWIIHSRERCIARLASRLASYERFGSKYSEEWFQTAQRYRYALADRMEVHRNPEGDICGYSLLDAQGQILERTVWGRSE